jgi:hypothetical protein
LVLISNLYAESLREIERDSGQFCGQPVFAGAMAISGAFPVYRVPYKTALQALHRLFHVAKRRAIPSVNEAAFASWQTHCLVTLDTHTSAAMLIVDAAAADHDLLRRCGYEL